MIRLSRILASYPPDDVRYQPTIDEEIERVKASRLEQVETLYQQYLGARYGELAIVGDFEPSEVLPLVAKRSTPGRPRSRMRGSSGLTRAV